MQTVFARSLTPSVRGFGMTCLVNLRKFSAAEYCNDAPRFFCSPPPPHRIFAARRRGADEGTDAQSGGIRDAGGRDHRSRKSFRRDRVLPGSDESRDQTNHRLRGLHGAGLDQRSPEHDARRGVSLHAAGEERGWLSQSRKTNFGGASRRIPLPAAHRQRTARGTFRRFDRDERLFERRDQHGDSGERSRESATEAPRSFAIFSARKIFFLEMHDHGIEAQHKCNAVLPQLAKEFGVGLVAANDVHFLERGHHEAHDVMICIGTGKLVADERRMRYVPELYFKSADEMRALFPDFPEAITNTVAIADRCNLELEFGRAKYPEYPAPEGKTREAYLRELCYKGLHDRYGERAGTDSELIKRLDYEVDILERTGFVSYILIVWDFIHFAKGKKIPVGPGRGSAAGSMVAYVLGITDVDPLKYGLLFERFLNPERVSPPDIDVDFCESRRGEVLEYVRQKYGERRVSQIITFGKLKAKSVVRDVGRVIGLSYGEADRIAKMIPNELNITLASAAEKTPDLKRAIETEASTRQLWDYAKVLEGLSRNAGVHAAGVVIGDRDLSDYVPLCRDVKGNDVISQYSMGPLNDLGLLKMDFLGLKTLTVIEDAVTLIRKRVPNFSIATIPLDDAASFALYNRGETIGLIPNGIGRDDGHGETIRCAEDRRHHRAHRALPTGPDGTDRRLHQTQKGTDEDSLRTSAAGGSLRGYLRRDDLPGTGHGGSEPAGGLLVRPGGFASSRDGKKGPRKDGEGARQLHQGLRGDKQNRGEKGERDFRSAGKICGLRIQQEPQRSLRFDQLSNRIFESELSGRIHVRIAQQRNQ